MRTKRRLPAEETLRIAVVAGRCGLVGLFLVALVAWSAANAPPAHCAGRDVTDGEITMAVESELWTDEVVDPNRIDVNATDGVVTLTGNVRTLLAKERAEMVAETIVGVRAVVNRMEVEAAAGANDVSLRDAVKSALLHDPATESYEVAVAVGDGIVTLSGSVESWQEKQLAETVAKNVRGVRGVENEIEVDYRSTRSDYEIEQEVKARLANDVRVDDYLVDVEVANGKVSLTGDVGSLYEKRRARMNSWVAGVESVDASGLEVKWWARDEMRRNEFYTSRGDEEIREAVKDAFLYDPRVLSFNPEVEVENGTVVLSGTVGNLAAKRAAEEDAENVVGVWRVKNHLKVRPEVVPTGDGLEQRVSRALRTDPYVDRFEIIVDASNGWVYLYGKVTTSYEKDRAERVVERTPGVVNVVNYITYEHEWRWKPDWEIENDVRDELFWSPYVDEDDVEVDVEGGVVTLTGTVDDWSERDAAENNAFEAGARDVDNDLAVRNRHYGPFKWDLWP